MDERSLLLLGMLKSQSQHGYQINEFIEKNLSRVINMKRSTAYTLLDRLCEQGYVELRMEQEGNRPARKVYTLTPQGEQKFTDLLREILEQADPMSSPFDVGLMFLDHITHEELLSALQLHLQRTSQQVAAYEAAPMHGFGKGVDIAMQHRLALLKAEQSWLQQMLTQLQQSESAV
ncbi:PadR family transcriptional regulator [Dictyobacter kobayashii]|uniref:PadR family transcriptional regulator n=1 Tax=Dictyobacter kobayashii TaxID=2014872 RepID=A0A402APW2_9CHLR|nr:PadR family transcriptional regulator [Dictyobacter kobayashii]GCE21203.1 PadR family transcriptional regulator [Dictyobacter kobayashii]